VVSDTVELIKKFKKEKMNLIIPMAGRGSRMRPHTLVTPKPLLPIAGKPMVQRLVESLDQTMEGTFENIGFIIGDFGDEVEESLLKVAESVGAKGHIFYQDKPFYVEVTF